MNNELLVSAKIPLEDGVILVEEKESDYWDAISIFYSEEDSTIRLPALTKLQWERLKRAGDYVFGEIIGE